MDWKKQAAEMYFGGSSINDIAGYTEKSRQSVSGYLKILPGYEEEKERRRKGSLDKRKEYKREKNKAYRAASYNEVTADTMKREHEVAVMLLSHERY